MDQQRDGLKGDAGGGRGRLALAPLPRLVTLAQLVSQSVFRSMFYGRELFEAYQYEVFYFSETI